MPRVSSRSTRASGPPFPPPPGTAGISGSTPAQAAIRAPPASSGARGQESHSRSSRHMRAMTSRAGKPFEVIEAYAGHDRAYFTKYVRDPKSVVPCAKMEAHPGYTDIELSGLVEFVTAGGR